MGLLECASGTSIWRGYDYYTNNKVQKLECTSGTQFRALVAGNASEPYTVEIDTTHIRKSKCNCPHANGRRIICKHMIAVFFTAFPEQAQEYYQKVVLRKEQEEQVQEEQADELVEYVHSMTKSELQEAILELLFDGPTWQYDRFVYEHLYEIDEYNAYDEEDDF